MKKKNLFEIISEIRSTVDVPIVIKHVTEWTDLIAEVFLSRHDIVSLKILLNILVVFLFLRIFLSFFFLFSFIFSCFLRTFTLKSANWSSCSSILTFKFWIKTRTDDVLIMNPVETRTKTRFFLRKKLFINLIRGFSLEEETMSTSLSFSRLFFFFLWKTNEKNSTFVDGFLIIIVSQSVNQRRISLDVRCTSIE